MSHNEYDDYHERAPSNASYSHEAREPSRHRPRHKQRLRRHERTQSQPQPINGLPSPAHAARGAAELAPQTYLSPPPHGGPSPTTEIALLPGGGVEIPPGFRFTQADQGHYRSRAEDADDGSGQPRVLGGLGFGMFKGLRKLPAALVRAGRGARQRQEADFSPEDRDNLPIDEDVETYVTIRDEDDGEAEARARQEQLLREYTQRRRMRRDREFRTQERVRRENYVPAPQPVPVPGSHTPAPSAVGHSEVPPPSAYEEQEMEEERKELARAQERQRARHMYAADAVKHPSTDSRTPTSQWSYYRTPSAPLPPRVFSHWAAERDSVGRRVENRSDGVPASATSPLSYAGFVRLLRQIRDMPWVGDRVAADYIPGGVRPLSSDYTSSAGFSGAGAGTSHVSPVPMLPPPPGQSWYAPRDSMLILPIGVAPPPGFVPYPDQHMSQVDHGRYRAHSTSSQTHVEAPVPLHASGPTYVEDDPYHYAPAAASATGHSHVSVPGQRSEHGRGRG